MLELTSDLFLGDGSHKATYRHPDDNTKCVKILICYKPDAVKQLKREIKHNLALQNRHQHLHEVAKYRGTEETNFGIGYIWDIVTDADGCVSISLTDYISKRCFLNDGGKNLENMLLEFRKAMLEKEIIPMDLKPQNLLCQKDNNGKINLVIIDDIGTAALIPLEYFFSFAAKKRIKRRWNRMIDGRMKDLCDDVIYRKVLDNVRFN